MKTLTCLGLLAAASIGISTLGLHPAQAQRHDVTWEDKWYPIPDGRENKIFIRRGRCPEDDRFCLQYRNDYRQKLRFKVSMLFNDTAKGTHAPTPRVMDTSTMTLDAGSKSYDNDIFQMENEPFLKMWVDFVPLEAE